MSNLNPYLSFHTNAREAMEFYQSVFGGDLQVMTFADMGGMGMPDDEHTLVMHSQLTTPDGFVLMGSDTPSHMEWAAPAGVSVSVSGSDDGSLRGFWNGLAEGATITQPLEKAPWGGEFGMLIDRFGISWMLSIDDNS
ncbi:VOC family protein [Microbacterium sp. ZW T5_56]|uniref:VOC family protein n=1 Tax=Microbacterium sp. ZW T5_56 TaxID=3378081 RepID=UPI0038519D65